MLLNHTGKKHYSAFLGEKEKRKIQRELEQIKWKSASVLNARVFFFFWKYENIALKTANKKLRVETRVCFSGKLFLPWWGSGHWRFQCCCQHLYRNQVKKTNFIHRTFTDVLLLLCALLVHWIRKADCSKYIDSLSKAGRYIFDEGADISIKSSKRELFYLFCCITWS